MNLSTLCDSAHSRDGRLHVFAEREGCVAIYIDRSDGGSDLRKCLGHKGDVRCVAISADSRVVASGGADGVVKVWNPDTGALICDCPGHAKPVNRLVFSADGRWLLSGDQAGATILWDPRTGARMAAGPPHASPITSLAFSVDGAKAASGAEDGAIRVWDAAGGKPVTDCVDAAGGGREAGVWALAFSPDSKYLASGGQDSRVKVWDVSSGACLHSLEGHQAVVTFVTFNAGGGLILSGSEDTTVKVWEAATGKMTSDIRGPRQGAVQELRIRPDGMLDIMRLPLQPRGFSISPDGRVGSDPAPPGVQFVLSTNEKVIGTPETIGSVAFSPDGLLAAAGSWNGSLRIWETQTGKYRKCAGHTGAVHRIAFSPDARLLASASDDNTVKIWDPRDGSCRGTLFYDGRVTVTFVPGAPLRLLVADRAGNAHVYELGSRPEQADRQPAAH